MKTLKSISITVAVAVLVTLTFQNCQKSQSASSADPVSNQGAPGSFSALNIDTYYLDVANNYFTMCGDIAQDASIGVTWTDPTVNADATQTDPTTVWFMPNVATNFWITWQSVPTATDSSHACVYIPVDANSLAVMKPGTGWHAAAQVFEGNEGMLSAMYDMGSAGSYPQ